jgi:hypothetical protein
MATADLNRQLKIQQDINKALQARAGLLKTQNTLLTGQAKLAGELKRAMSGEGLDGLEERLGTIGDALTKAADATEKQYRSQSKLGQKVRDTAGALGTQGKAVQKFGSKWLRAGFVIGTTLDGMIEGLLAGVAQVEALIRGADRIATGFFNVAKSIFTIPFKMITGLAHAADELAHDISPVAVAMEEVRKQFGNLATREGKAVIGSFKQLRKHGSNVAGTGLSIRRMFGKGRTGAANALKFLNEKAQELGNTFSLLRKEFQASGDLVVAYTKGLGLTKEGFGALGKRAVADGRLLTEVLRDSANLSIQLGKKFGISAKLIGRDIGEMAADFDNFGTLSQTELATTAVFTRKLGIEIKDLQGVIGKFDDFESAAESVSKLNQAFGLQVDTIKMMNAQNPAERLDMLRDSFMKTGRTVEGMTRQELKLLGAQAGLSAEAAKTAFSQENLGMSYDEIQKSSKDSHESQLSQAKVTKDLGKEIERVYDGALLKFNGFSDALGQGFRRGILRNNDFRKALKNLRGTLLKVYDLGVKLGKVLPSIFPGMQGLLKTITEIFDPKKWGMLTTAIYPMIVKFFKELGDPTKAPAALNRLFKAVSDKFLDIFGPEFKSKTLPLLKKSALVAMKAIGQIVVDLIPVALKGLTNIFSTMTQVLNDPSSLKKGTKGTKGFAGMLSNLFGQALKHFEKNGPALMDAMSKFFKTFYAKYKGPINKVLFFLAANIFGKAALGMFAGFIKGMFVEKLGDMLAGSIKSMFTKSAPAIETGFARKYLPTFMKGFDKLGGAAKSGLGRLSPIISKAAKAAPWALLAYGAVKGIMAGFEKKGSIGLKLEAGATEFGGSILSAMTLGMADSKQIQAWGDWLGEALIGAGAAAKDKAGKMFDKTSKESDKLIGQLTGVNKRTSKAFNSLNNARSQIAIMQKSSKFSAMSSQDQVRINSLYMEASKVDNRIKLISKLKMKFLTAKSGADRAAIKKDLTFRLSDLEVLQKEVLQKKAKFAKAFGKVSASATKETADIITNVSNKLKEADKATAGIKGITAQANMDKFTEALSVKNKTVKVDRGPVNVTINLQVSLAADKLSDALIDTTIVGTDKALLRA